MCVLGVQVPRVRTSIQPHLQTAAPHLVFIHVRAFGLNLNLSLLLPLAVYAEDKFLFCFSTTRMKSIRFHNPSELRVGLERDYVTLSGVCFRFHYGAMRTDLFTIG